MFAIEEPIATSDHVSTLFDDRGAVKSKAAVLSKWRLTSKLGVFVKTRLTLINSDYQIENARLVTGISGINSRGLV